jgi:NAD(P)-dependent dehydrogenase (short-subunit alcohol dehydrogenase family)
LNLLTPCFKIGKICALELAKKNAHVIVAARTPSKALVVVDEIKAETKNEKVEFIQLDLLSLASVSKFIAEFKAKNLPLHLLLNNAGVMACPYGLSKDGYETQFATNHVRIMKGRGITNMVLTSLNFSSNRTTASPFLSHNPAPSYSGAEST